MYHTKSLGSDTFEDRVKRYEDRPKSKYFVGSSLFTHAGCSDNSASASQLINVLHKSVRR